MELHLKISGLIMIVLALLHAAFPRYFKWGEELKVLSLLSRQIMLVHTFFIALTVLLLGMLSVSEPDALAHSALGRKISLGIGIFWGLRMIFQFFVYSPAHWRHKRFETAIHVLFSVLWTYFTWTYLMTAFHAVVVE